MNANVILAVLWISVALIPIATMFLSYFGVEPNWLLAITDDRVALAWGTGLTALGFVALIGRGSWFALAWVTLCALAVHIVIAEVRLWRLLRRRRHEATASDA